MGDWVKIDIVSKMHVAASIGMEVPDALKQSLLLWLNTPASGGSNGPVTPSKKAGIADPFAVTPLPAVVATPDSGPCRVNADTALGAALLERLG